MEIQQVNEQVFPQLYRVTLYAEILSLLGAGRDGGTQVREICRVTGKGNRARIRIAKSPPLCYDRAIKKQRSVEHGKPENAGI